MNRDLILSNQASRSIRHAPRDDRDQLRAALHLLLDNPFAGDIKRLEGGEGTFRRRVDQWRILYEISPKDRLIVVSAIKRRGANTY